MCSEKNFVTQVYKQPSKVMDNIYCFKRSPPFRVLMQLKQLMTYPCEPVECPLCIHIY